MTTNEAARALIDEWHRILGPNPMGSLLYREIAALRAALDAEARPAAYVPAVGDVVLQEVAGKSDCVERIVTSTGNVLSYTEVVGEGRSWCSIDNKYLVFKRRATDAELAAHGLVTSREAGERAVVIMMHSPFCLAPKPRVVGCKTGCCRMCLDCGFGSSRHPCPTPGMLTSLDDAKPAPRRDVPPDRVAALEAVLDATAVERNEFTREMNAKPAAFSVGMRVRVVRHRPGGDPVAAAILPIGSEWTIIRHATPTLNPGAFTLTERFGEWWDAWPDEIEPAPDDARPAGVEGNSPLDKAIRRVRYGRAGTSRDFDESVAALCAAIDARERTAAEEIARLKDVIEVAERLDRGEKVERPQPHPRIWSIVAGNRAYIKELVERLRLLEAK